jgi:hypothetical protein
LSKHDKSHREMHRREVIWLLLSGIGLLGGCSTRPGYKPTLPESCVWLKFPYTWMCIDPNEGMPVPEQETSKWDPIPLTKIPDESWYNIPWSPITWEELARDFAAQGGSLPDVSRYYQYNSEDEGAQ